MAYNPYSAVNAIYNLKGQWDNADKAGDATTKNNIASKAQQYYKQLRSNGYDDIADQLTASNYTQAKSINDKWAKMGKTSTRDYLYSLGQSKGMTQSDVDKLIGWDNQTGEVSFGGKKIGTPDTVVDGVSYWGDTSVLDNAFDDYVKRSGTTTSDSLLQSQHNTEIKDKTNQLWGIQTDDRQAMADKYGKLEETAYSNPFTTDEAKAILAKYDLAGLQGRDNAVASGSASNGGNIDSFAASNAMRQQAALVNQGQMAVLEAHNNKLNNIKGVLESLGVYQQNQDLGMQNTIGLQQSEAQRLFENSETAKNNDVSRKVAIAGVTGYTPTEWTYDNNIYLNSDGTVKDEYLTDEFDNTGGFTTIINNAKAKLATTTDATERANLQATINAAIQAKALKTFSSPKYASYAHEVTNIAPTSSESRRQFDESMKYNYDILEADKLSNTVGKASGRVVSSGSGYKSGSGSGYTATLSAAQAAKALENGVFTKEVLDSYNAHFGTNFTVDNPPQIVDGKVVIPGAKTVSESDVDTDQLQNDYDEVYEASDTTVQDYMREVLGPLAEQGTLTEDDLKKNLLANSAKYDLEVKDIKNICEVFGADTKWVDGYKDSGLFGWGSGVKKR